MVDVDVDVDGMQRQYVGKVWAKRAGNGGGERGDDDI